MRHARFPRPGKAGETSRTLFSFVDFPFMVQLLLLSVVVALIQSWRFSQLSNFSFEGVIPELLPSLQNTQAAVRPTSDLLLLGRVFSTWIFSLFLPAVLFSFASRILFFSLGVNAQRLIGLTLFALYAGLSCLALLASNAVWHEESWLSGIPLPSPTVFLSLRAVLLFITAASSLAPFMNRSESRSSRVLRVGLLTVLIATWLFIDWTLSQRERNIAVENRSMDSPQTFVLFVPKLSPGELQRALERPELEPWKSRLQTMYAVQPVSDSEVAQFTSALTGLQPYEHGIRLDYQAKDELRSAAKRIHEISQKLGLTLHMSNLGDTHPVGELINDVGLGTKCRFTVNALYERSAIGRLFYPASQLPDALFQFMFPQVLCTQKFSPLPSLVREELKSVSDLLQNPVKLLSIWWINPDAGLGVHRLSDVGRVDIPRTAWQKAPDEVFGRDGKQSRPEHSEKANYFLHPGHEITERSDKESETRLAILYEVLSVFHGYLEFLKLSESARLVVVGLGSDESVLSVAAVFQNKKVQTVQNTALKNTLLGTAHLHQIITDKEPDPQTAPYFESIKFPSQLSRAGEDSDSVNFATPLSQEFVFDWSSGLQTGTLHLHEDVFHAAVRFATRMMPCVHTESGSIERMNVYLQPIIRKRMGSRNEPGVGESTDTASPQEGTDNSELNAGPVAWASTSPSIAQGAGDWQLLTPHLGNRDKCEDATLEAMKGIVSNDISMTVKSDLAQAIAAIQARRLIDQKALESASSLRPATGSEEAGPK